MKTLSKTLTRSLKPNQHIIKFILLNAKLKYFRLYTFLKTTICRMIKKMCDRHITEEEILKSINNLY